MSERKYQVFVSSTYSDLVKEREAVIKAILNLYQFPIGMEMFSADDDDQWEVIKETISTSDFYILIIGSRYGSTRDGLSYTEREYEFAKSIGVPILTFVRDPDSATTPSQRERNPESQEKLKKFVAKATSNRLCDFWRTPDELTNLVTLSLFKAFRKYQRDGWIRGDQATSPEVTTELARLSHENGFLKEQLELLRKSEPNREPALIASIYNALEGEFEIESPQFERPLIEIGPVEIEDDVRDCVSQQEVHDYIELFPTEDEINSHLARLECYHRCKHSCLFLGITVENLGSHPASGVIIDLTFPEGFLIFNHNDWRMLTKPKIDIPENPIIKARTKIAHRTALDYASLFAPGFSSATDPILNYSLMPTLKNGPDSVYVESDREAQFQLARLSHTREFKFDSIVVVPPSKGEFLVNARVFCDEFTEVRERDLHLRIA